MTVRLEGATSGYTELDAPAVAGNNRLVLPPNNGSIGNILGVDSQGNLIWVHGRMVLETAKNATGTSVDFTGIPSWVKRVTAMFNGVSTNGTSNLLVQIGSGSITSSGYTSCAVQLAASNTTASATSGYIATGANSTALFLSGHLVVTNVSDNIWVASSTLASTTGNNQSATGVVTLSNTLDRIRITTANGTDTFDAGSINILYEG